MLKSFSVTNFKNFQEKVTIEFDRPANYEFNSRIVKNGIITKAIIYGVNGSGKSNLALALFDIVAHLTDKQKILGKYRPYQNMNSEDMEAHFEYVLGFDDIDVIYRYGKLDVLYLTYEELTIGTQEVLKYDYTKQEGFVRLEGTETLQLQADGMAGLEQLSRVKYIRNNALLKDNKVNKAFLSFTSFVDNMLMFYSLQENQYQGFMVGSEFLTQSIIKEGMLPDFERFLRSQGIDYNLMVADLNGSSEIYCKFENGKVPFMSIASTGTKSLALFYYWYIRMKKASFVYIDEFDAFYHFELAQKIVEMVKELEDTQVVFSTHNTDLISNELLRPDAYYLIKNNKIQSFDKNTEKELRKAHNLQKMFKAGAFDE